MKTKLAMPAISIAAMAAARPSAVLGSVRADGGAGNIEQLMRDVKSELTRVGDDVKRTAEDALRQSKEAGTASAEVKATADTLLSTQRQLEDAQQKLIGRLEQLETRNTDVEQQLAQRGGRSGEPEQTIGQRFTSSDEVKAFIAAGGHGTAKMKLPVRQAITSGSGSAGALITPDRESAIVGMPRRQMTIRALLTQGRTSSNSVEYPRQTGRTNNAAPVAEAAQKPESSYVWGPADAPVRTIAHWVHVSRQALDDAAQLETEIDGELRYGLALAEEAQILKGDGVGQNLAGLVGAASAYSAAFAVPNETMIDTLRLALLQASLAEFPSDGIVLNPIDWARLELTKDGENRYIFANVIQMAGPQLWGRPVIATQSMDEDEFLTGAFRAAATIYDRMDPEVLISSEDRDNFIKNMLTIRAEERLALAIKRPGALITGDFGNVSG